MSDLEQNIKRIRERIAKAAEKSGRKPEDITLVAVTKTVSTDIMQQALNLGIRDLGENRVQEIEKKYPFIHQAQPVNWHLIGHLQTNKVKYIIDKVALIHSVDDIKLAEEIEKRAKKIEKIADILIQVNVSGEESKFGIAPEELDSMIGKLSTYHNIRVRGLMTIAPYTNNPEDVRPFFQNLRKLSIDIMAKNYDNINMDYLSMGMTGDFEIAIEEGANIVRVGTGLFGER